MMFLRAVIAACLLFNVVSCSSGKVSYHYPRNQDINRKARTGKFMDSSWLPFSDKKDEEEPAKEKKEYKPSLWQTSVQVVGLMFPLSIIDEKSGIVATEWHQETPDSNTRIKINVLIRDGETLQDSIRVSVFQQKRLNKNTSWEGGGLHSPESVASSAQKAQEIKEEILKRIKTGDNNE